jgi:hypothetical protein
MTTQVQFLFIQLTLTWVPLQCCIGVIALLRPSARCRGWLLCLPRGWCMRRSCAVWWLISWRLVRCPGRGCIWIPAGWRIGVSAVEFCARGAVCISAGGTIRRTIAWWGSVAVSWGLVATPV